MGVVDDGPPVPYRKDVPVNSVRALRRPSEQAGVLLSGRLAPALPSNQLQVSFGALVGVGIGCVLVIGFFTRRAFLYNDDYALLGQAREMSFGWSYLVRDMMGHFSPVSRVVHKAIVGMLPGRSWLVPLTLWVLAAVVVVCVATMMVALFGRSRQALIGFAVVGSSLTLLPLTNWWTSGVNNLPGMAGAALFLAAIVFLVRGRTRSWALVAVLSYTVAILDWETTALMPGYAFLWVALFHTRVTGDSLRLVFRRTWWLWLLLAIIAYLWLYVAVNSFFHVRLPGGGDVVKALSVSLFQTLVPSLLGFYGPSTHWFTTLGTVLGLVVLGCLLVVSFVHSGRAWRGWLFATAGWLLPSTALVLNRAAYSGPVVAERGMYFFLPSMLFMVGVLEAFAGPRRVAFWNAGEVHRADNPRPPRWQVMTFVGVLAVMVPAYLKSAPSSIQALFDYGTVANTTAPERDYVANVLASADGIDGGRNTFSIIDADVPVGLVPDLQLLRPYNRLSRVIALADPSIRFDAVDGSHWVADKAGRLHPARIDWSLERTLTKTGDLDALDIVGVDNARADAKRGLCFRVAEPEARVLLPLPEPIVGDQLVVQTIASVDRPSTERVGVQAPGTEFFPANDDNKYWLPEAVGQLDTVSAGKVSAVSIVSMTVGTNVCLYSISVGEMVLSD